MITKQNATIKKVFKNPPRITKSGMENGVDVIKHFQPSLVYCHRGPLLSNDFPDVNSDIDNTTSQKTARYPYHTHPKLSSNVISTPKVHTSAMSSINRSKNGNCKFENLCKPKARPLERTSSSTQIEEHLNKSAGNKKQTQRSKSFIQSRKREGERIKQVNCLSSDSNLCKRDISSKHNLQSESHIRSLKNEIEHNRIDSGNFKSSSWCPADSRKINHASCSNRVTNIHQEISCMRKQQMLEKRIHLTELNSELAEHKRFQTYQVYSVFNEGKENVVKTSCNGDPTSENSKEKENHQGYESNAIKDGFPCELRKKVGIFYSDSDSPEESEIRSKIEEANILVERVREALTYAETFPKDEIPLEINCNALNANSDPLKTDTDLSQTRDASEMVVVQTVAKIHGWDRPKTRRNDTEEVITSVKATNRFKTHRGLDVDQYDHGLQALQEKLNAISENSETEISSSTEDPEKLLQLTINEVSKNDMRYNDVIIQAAPVTKDCSIQTVSNDIPKKSLVVENHSAQTICPGVVNKSMNLMVQVMPPISLRKKLTVEKTLNLSVDSKGVVNDFTENALNHVCVDITNDRTVAGQLLSLTENKRESSTNENNVGTRHDRQAIRTVLPEKFSRNTPYGLANNSNEDIRDLIYKSYDVYDNVNSHDPGILDHNSYTMPNEIDGEVYKTFINPAGSTSFITNDKVKGDPQSSPLYKKYTISSGSHGKAIDIYSSKIVQCPSTTFTKSPKLESSETITITISYSSEETVMSDLSDSEPTNEKLISTVNLEQPCLDNKREITNSRPQLGNNSHVKIPTSGLLNQRFERRNTVAEEENTNDSFHIRKRNTLDINCESVMEGTSDSTGSPIMNSNGSKDNPTILQKIDKVSPVLNPGEKTSCSKKCCQDPIIMNVHVQGDYVPPHLQLGNNGRYKDEENLFCESTDQKQTFSMLKGNYQCLPRIYTRRYNLDSSDTFSSLSEGEVRCQHSASNGEMHMCKKQIKKQKPKNKLTCRKFDDSEFEKTRTYFNCMNYRFWSNNAIVSDSTASTSST